MAVVLDSRVRLLGFALIVDDGDCGCDVVGVSRTMIVVGRIVGGRGATVVVPSMYIKYNG